MKGKNQIVPAFQLMPYRANTQDTVAGGMPSMASLKRMPNTGAIDSVEPWDKKIINN